MIMQTADTHIGRLACGVLFVHVLVAEVDTKGMSGLYSRKPRHREAAWGLLLSSSMQTRGLEVGSAPAALTASRSKPTCSPPG